MLSFQKYQERHLENFNLLLECSPLRAEPDGTEKVPSGSSQQRRKRAVTCGQFTRMVEKVKNWLKSNIITIIR